LRLLHRNYLSTTLRAFADDIGLIVNNVAHLMGIQAEFQTFATISGLALNLPKTVIVPLWESTIAGVTRLINDDYPCLAGMTVSYAAKYLGIWIGPEGYNLAWTEALEKFKKAIPRWTTAGWGLQLSTLIYNVYLASILGFVAQLYPPTPEVVQAEQMALRRFLRGPGTGPMRRSSSTWTLGLASRTSSLRSRLYPWHRGSEWHTANRTLPLEN
jgi:hypothetical protein